MLWSPPSHHPFLSTFFASPKQTRCSQLQRAIAGLGVGIPDPSLHQSIDGRWRCRLNFKFCFESSIFVYWSSTGAILIISSFILFFPKYPDRSGCLFAPVDVKSSEHTFKSIVTWTKTWKSVNKDPGKKQLLKFCKWAEVHLDSYRYT